MDIYIHKTTLGFQQHLVVKENGSIHRIKDIPEDSVLVYGESDLREVAKVYNLPVPSFPPLSYQKALGAVLKAGDDTAVPWPLLMPPKAFKRAVDGLAEELRNTFTKIDLGYYLNHYKETLPILELMNPAKIDPRAWMVHTNDSELVTPHVLNSFQPDSSWFSSKITYSKSDTKTGRLKVVQGPNILHLPKEQRNIFGSRFGKDGRLLSFDFRALEPRIVLFLKDSSPSSGNPPRMASERPGEDIYQDVLTSLGIRDIGRDKVKDVILSQLYGAGYDKVLSGLTDVSDPSGFVEAVNDFFGLDMIRERLIEEYEENDRDHILSFYGRPLDTREARPYMLLNYFTQSTAVDVAMHGFSNILKLVKDQPMVVPLFIIHDALVLDVHNSVMDLIPQILWAGSHNIPGFPDREFALKVSRF